MSKHFKRGSAVAAVAAVAAGTYGATLASAQGTSTPGQQIGAVVGAIVAFVVDLVLGILGGPGDAIGSLLGG